MVSQVSVEGFRCLNGILCTKHGNFAVKLTKLVRYNARAGLRDFFSTNNARPEAAILDSNPIETGVKNPSQCLKHYDVMRKEFRSDSLFHLNLQRSIKKRHMLVTRKRELWQTSVKNFFQLILSILPRLDTMFVNWKLKMRQETLRSYSQGRKKHKFWVRSRPQLVMHPELD